VPTVRLAPYTVTIDRRRKEYERINAAANDDRGRYFEASKWLVAEKTLRFQNRNLDLDLFSQRIVDDLKSEGFATQISKDQSGIVIQAKKESLLRDITTAERCLTILVRGEPDDVTVRVGIGKWIQNLAVLGIERFLQRGSSCQLRFLKWLGTPASSTTSWMTSPD